MEVFEKINLIIQQQKLTKRAFSKMLIALEPKLKSTGEIPSENTIYSYLSGRITIPIELLPFIAESLNVTEQELFDTTEKTKKICFKSFLENASESELDFLNTFINSKIHNNININYGKVIMEGRTVDKKVKCFINLLEYAPANFLDKAIEKLEEYKNISSEF